MLDLKLNHEGEALHECFNLAESTANRIKSYMFYQSLSNASMASDLYDDVDDAPRSMTTKTGRLEKILLFANSDNERAFILSIFFAETMRLEEVARRSFRNQMLKQTIDNESSDKLRKAVSEIILALSDQTFKAFDELVKKVSISNDDFSIFMSLIDEDDPDMYIQDAMDAILKLGQKDNSSDDE